MEQISLPSRPLHDVSFVLREAPGKQRRCRSRGVVGECHGLNVPARCRFYSAEGGTKSASHFLSSRMSIFNVSRGFHGLRHVVWLLPSQGI